MSNSPEFDYPKENRILFDWVSLTTRNHTIYELIELLGFRDKDIPFETVKGSKGFMWRMYFNGVSIHFNERSTEVNGEFIWLEMSGQGCRAFESYGNGDYNRLFSLAREDPQNVHLTRLDIAFDDMIGVFDINTICEFTKEQYFTSRIQTYQAIYSNKGNSVTFGSRMSKVLVRIYDKAKERGFENGLHWVRCELQLKDNNALGFANKLLNADLRELYLGVLKNYLMFRLPSNDSNKRRWKEAPWWSEFLDDAVRTSVFSKPGVDYNLSVCERYVLTQPVGSIKTLIEVYGKDAFFEMINRAPPPKNPKYRILIAQAKLEAAAQSDSAVLDKYIELVGDNEIEALAELKAGYDEAYRLAKFNAKLRMQEKEAERKYHEERLFNEHVDKIEERIKERIKKLEENQIKGDT